jgi:hypothetical protein
MGRKAGRIHDDAQLAFFAARYRETGDTHYARRAYAWARDATDPPSRDIPEWVLECFDRQVDALFALDEQVRADAAFARNHSCDRPRRDTYFSRVVAAVGWRPSQRLDEWARQFIGAYAKGLQNNRSKTSARQEAARIFKRTSKTIKRLEKRY